MVRCGPCFLPRPNELTFRQICDEKPLCAQSFFCSTARLTQGSYKLALDQIPHARKLAAKHDIPFSRPGDYYAEMVKSDEHMERVRTKLVEEA